MSIFMNLLFELFQRLVVCLEESLYIHNIRDMKVLHTIRETPPNKSGLCALSTDSENCYLAYPGHSSVGELQVNSTYLWVLGFCQHPFREGSKWVIIFVIRVVKGLSPLFVDFRFAQPRLHFNDTCTHRSIGSHSVQPFWDPDCYG